MRSLLLLLCLTSASLTFATFRSYPPSSSEDLGFLYDGYNATIYENSRPRTYLGSSRLMAVPLDSLPSSAQLRFTITHGDPDEFFTAETEEIGGMAVLQIRTRTGMNDVLNRERKAHYFLTVKGEVRSHHKSYSAFVSTIVRVEVLDINDNIPLFYEDSYDVIVGEDSNLHTPLLTVSAEDADTGPNGKVYYSLLDPTSDYFCVHPTSGVVSLTRTLDSSIKAQHKVIIIAEDRGIKSLDERKSLASQAVINVNVLKVNLHSPKLNVNHLPYIIEHAHTNIYAIITVTDRDTGKNGKIKNVDIISGNPNQLFSIIKGSKVNEYNLAVLKLLDRELAPVGYNLTIRAIDEGKPPRLSLANIHVNIADINDQAPVFLKEQYDEAVSEEAPPHTAVVRVAASDIDQGNNGKVLFRILAGNENNMFTINPHTGLISTNDWLDAETTAYYSLAVSAVDQASNAQRKQSSAKVVVRVLDGNDNSPQFSTPNTEVLIDENEPTGSYVTRVLASDADSGENGFVSYSIANLDQVPFTVDPFDGTIRTSTVLDFEAERRVYTIKVRASDWGQPLKQETETTVKVKVRDVNDNRPVFVGSVCSGWIDLDSAVGSIITKFQAIDLDDGDKVFYRLENSDLNECWALDSTSGVLAVACKLREAITKERKRTLIINVTATDGRHISDKASLSLALIDKDQDTVDMNRNSARVACEDTNILKKQLENEKSARENNEAVDTFALFPPRYGYNSHAPEFPPKFPDSIDILEDVEIGYEVMKVDAKDHDRGYNGRIVYAIASGDNDSVFEIDTFTGYIYVAAELDREKTEKFLLNITAYDLGIPHKMSSKNVTINVLDVNDNAPQFTQLGYSLHLPENTRNGTSVAQIIAQDPDIGLNGQVTYELITKLKDFTLDHSTGVLYVSNYLDREIREKYDLRVRAWDSAVGNPKFSLARVLVTVLDVNDCAPDFGVAKEIKISVPEDYPVGAVIVSLQASDRDLGDGGVVTYSIISGSHGKFRVDPKTGVVRVASSLDFETHQFYNMTIKAEDSGSPSLSSTAILLVQVTNVDENLGPPEVSQRVIRASVLENEPPGAFVTAIEASDPDGGEISYAIVGGSGKGVFSITKKGKIRTLRRLDRETKKGYWLTITLSDDGTVPLTDTCHVYVEVVDVNDHIPQSQIPVYRPTVKEDAAVGTTVVILKASDGDLASSNITFFISRSRRRRNGWMLSHPEGEEDAQEVFAINKETGVVTTTAPLDRERQSEYDIWVGVTDGQRTSLTPVFVTVSDVNDNAPKFLEKIYRFNVPSRAKSKPQKRAPLVRVFARDEDVSRNADIRYSIRTKKGKSRFKIDESTGYIFCSKTLVPGQTFDLAVKATDNGFPQLSSTAHVIIRIVDAPETSDNPPTVDVPPPAHVMETDPVGHVVTFINAFDLDNDTLWYSIDEGNDDFHFSIDLDSGLLSLAKELDREKQNLYRLTVAVTDGVHTTTTQLTVRVMDFNDHRPVFSRSLYETTVSESTKVGTTLLTLKCHDRDGVHVRAHSSSLTLPSSSLFFSVHHTESVESESLFTVDTVTGDLILAQPLNREVTADHLLTVSCQDRGGIQREDLSRVAITVKDANDHPPVFLESTIESQVSEGALPGTVVARVTAIDQDEGENGRISYSIVEGNQGATFTINPELGHVILAEPLLQTKTKEFLLLVRAIDHALKPKAASIPIRISVKSSSDIPPTWKGTSVRRVIELSEWTPPNTVVAIVTASAPPSLMYEIESGNSDEETFVVSPSSGILSLNVPLDYELTNFYNLSIKATNAAGVSRSLFLAVRVLDENDWIPEWESLNYEGTVIENAEMGSPVLESGYLPKPLTVKTVDRDTGRNGRVTYSVVERDIIANLFSVDEYTGAIRVAGRLQDVIDEFVELRIWARDSGTPRRECIAPSTVKIYVKKIAKSTISFDSPLYKADIYLPTVSGVKVLCVSVSQSPVQSDHSESSLKKPVKPVKYLITAGDKENNFKIDPTSGCIYIAKHVSLLPFYNLTVNASSVATKVLINVRSLPKGALKFTQEAYYTNVLENTTNELNLLAVGVKGLPINSPVQYTLLNSHDYFEVRPTSGILKTTGKPFDWEKQDYFSLIVQAKELENEKSFGNAVVNVAVLDVNDNEPVFLGQPYDALVSTAAERGHVIAKVRAVDADSGVFGEVRYELVRGSGELFHVGKTTGEISLKQVLTEAQKTLSLTIAAYDGGKQPLSSQAHVIVRVVAAEGPLFEQILYKVTIPENKQVGSAATRIEARSSTGNDLIYSIISGDPEGFFDLDYQTGVLRVASRLDYEIKTNHNLTIRAKDPLTGLHSDCHAVVDILDINDNAPHFQKVKFVGEVSEAAVVGQTILKVQAYDRDTGSGGVVRYECVEYCGNFTIDPESGYVVLDGVLDAERETIYTFFVLAKDQGLPPLTAKALVEIKVIDFNDNGPFWPQDTYSCHVSTEAKAGHVLTTMSAFDPDVSNTDGLHLAYHVISGDPQSLFYIEPSLGLVSVTAPHKLVGGSVMILNISASDGVHISFTSLRISIIPANDNEPQFVKPLFESAVEENAAPGQFVVRVEAKDGDGGLYGTVRYEILGQEKERKFSIDDKGNMYTEISLDRELEPFHEVVVSGSDPGGKSGFARVRIYVKDKNDFTPLFTLPEYQANIPVDTPPLTSILKVTAEDADEGSNSRVSYELYEEENADALELFSINSETGEVFLNVEILEKANEVFQFFIRATDGGVPPLHSDVPVTIFLISSHERPPFCPRKYAQFFLSEDDPVGTVVTSLWHQESADFKYILINSKDAQEGPLNNLEDDEEGDADDGGGTMPFGLSSSSEVIVHDSLDHERKRLHTITVVNQTLTTPPLVDYMTISVVVMDVNDCRPEFSSAVYDVVVAENTAVGSVITHLTATDKDEGNNGQIQYSFKNSTNPWIKSVFSVDPHTASISLIAPLDREANDSLSFIVVAADNGPSSLSAEAVVNINVKDYNDNPPVFIRDIYVTNVPEDTTVGTVVVELALHDEDAEQSRLDFFVLGNDDGGRFLVHTSGQVYVARALDREARDHYTLIVTATDGKFSANTTVSVNVIDVNDNGPECKENVYRRSVAEDAAVGSHVVSVAVYDPDEGLSARSRFHLTGEGAKHFSVDHQTGKVVVGQRLDRESQEFYELLISVEDWEESNWRCESTLYITVTDVNDNPPRFLHENFSIFISEDSAVNAVLTKVIATDADLGMNRRLRYSLSDSADGYFSIDPTEGVVTLMKTVDRETQDTFTLVVEAKDMGKPAFSSSAVLTVTVTDVNDNAPEFVRTLQQVTVAENSAVGSEISRVMATSKDIGVNADISYSLEHTTDQQYLAIHPKTGVISINSPLDYEEVQLVVVTVIAVDGGTPPLSATALVNVTVTDVNDNSPVFTRAMYETTVAENLQLGRSVLQVSAKDRDCGKNGEVSFLISKGNDLKTFAIASDSGILSLLHELDREKVSEYVLEIVGRDKGSPPNSASTLVKIEVGDVNDNPPKFVDANYTAIVQENRPVGYKVFGFLVTDADADPNGHPFTWELLGALPASSSPDQRPFSLDQDGTLRLATNKLDHRVKKLYEVSVRVWDSGSPPLSADATVQITVVEESRYPPMLFPLYAHVTSYLKPYPGGIIGKVIALDQDSYDVLQFSIIEQTESDTPDYFDIDGQDGTLVALTPLDSGVYTVNLSVSDGKYRRSVGASVTVLVVDDAMVDSSLILRLGPLSSEEFLSRYKKLFLTTLSSEIHVGKGRIHILSLQPSILHSHSVGIGNHSRDTRHIYNLHRSLDILLVIEDEEKNYISREKVKELISAKTGKIQSILGLPLFAIMNSICSVSDKCSDHGVCIDVINIIDDVPTIFSTQSSSFVSPPFSQVIACLCNQGYDGQQCENLVNACGRRPCSEYEECIPSATLSRGYSCRCPSGKAGPRCGIDLSKCQKPLCHYPLRPLSFKGKSYAQYSMQSLLESNSMQLSTYVRTRHSAGVIFYASGDVDYSILEIYGGSVQYRWDCGSGEGLVRVSNIRVDDNKWHFINISREGTVSKLIVDESSSSGASPGLHDILNLELGNLFVGAKVESYIGSTSSLIEFGFVGCLDLLVMDGINLPTDVSNISPTGKVSLKRLANVEINCPETLSLPGICGSHPCLNGGTCAEQGKKYTCSCLARFAGRNCEIDTAPCSSSPCLNGGTCKVVGHNYICKCPIKLSGKRCEYGVFCNPNPCQNGGRCEEGINGPICKCQHFTGAHCEMDIDECMRSPCRNGGTCLNLYGGFRCLCASNVTGEYCTESLYKIVPKSNFFLTFQQLIFVLVIILAFIFIILVFFVCQRRKWRYKRHQQNNRVKLTGHHVKNDLKANDAPKRNSKICNVEADQGGTADSVLLQTLKQLADQDGLELSTLTRRRSNEYVHNLTKPSAVVAPMTSSPSTAEARLKRKPWDHHNNLNESYFTPSKDIGLDLPQNLENHSRGASPQRLNLSFSDNSSVPNHQNERVFQWDDYDLRGSSPMLTTFGTLAGGGGLKDSVKNIALKSGGTAEDTPLLEGNSIPDASVSPSTPLLINESRDDHKNPLDGASPETCSFDDVLLHNNISALEKDSNRPPPPPVRFNIEAEEKISNIDPYEEDGGEIVMKEEKVGMGSPRSRKPFVRSDFGRASDVSFLSTLTEEDKSETESYL